MATEDIIKTQEEQAYEDWLALGEELTGLSTAECILSVPDTSIEAGLEVEWARTGGGDYVVDNMLLFAEDAFLAHFDPSLADYEEEPEAEEEEAEPAAEAKPEAGWAYTVPEGLSYDEMFEWLLLQTGREGVEKLINYCQTSDFYISPASTQYHGSYEGGLLKHSLNVYETLVNLADFTRLLNPGTPELDMNSIVIVSLLHDICKANTYEPGTRNVKNAAGQWEKVDTYFRKPLLPMGHGGKSVFIIQQFIQLTPEEALAIFWHMGGFDISNYNTLNEMGQTYNENLLAILLHQADMMATYVVENPEYEEEE